MDFSTIKDLYVGSTPAQSVWLGGTKVWERKPAVDIQSIFDAMVLWYDPKRQGATNENMAENPVLEDLSGNGHDATCYNFAWSGMSGVGSYTNFREDTSRGNFEILGTQKWLIKSLKTENSLSREPILCEAVSFNGHGKALTIKIDGIPEGSPSNFLVVKNNLTTFKVELHNGDNAVTFSADTEGYFIFRFENIDAANITIEVLPEYPDALVADGVDDYAKVEGLPLLDDYTVIAKRDFINTDANGVTAVKGESVAGGKNQAFSIDIFNYNAETYYGAFGNTIAISQDIINAEIVEATPDRINNKTISTSGSNDIWPYLHLCGYPDNDRYNNIALYSFILFNRTLTNDEIEWVKDNLIEGTYKNLEALLIDAWVFSGHTNEEAPTKITGEKGTALNCYNFAWNEEGSGFKDGFLCFDGVNDSLSNYKHLPLLKTVIAKYVIPKQTYNSYRCSISFADAPNKNTAFNFYDGALSKTQLISKMSGYGYLLYDVAQDEVHTDYLNTYGRNGEPYIKNDTTEMYDTYQITMGCRYNNVSYMQVNIAYAAIYSESLTDEECMAEIQRLDALWESRKQ